MQFDTSNLRLSHVSRVIEVLKKFEIYTSRMAGIREAMGPEIWQNFAQVAGNWQLFEIFAWVTGAAVSSN